MMRHLGLFCFPVTFPFLLLLVLLARFVFLRIESNVVGYTYECIGIHQRYVFLVLLQVAQTLLQEETVDYEALVRVLGPRPTNSRNLLRSVSYL